MTMTTLTFPFQQGLQQSVEDRLLDAGRPRAIENLVIAKRGRLSMRRDYDALSMVQQGGSTLNLYDLVSWNGRLLGLGEASDSTFGTQSPVDVIEFANQPLYGWRKSVNSFLSHRVSRLPVVSYMRNVGRVSDRSPAVSRVDVAAGGGLVCCVWEEPFATPQLCVHVFDPKTDTTVLFNRQSGFKLPRVVGVGSVFYVGCANSTATTPKLFRYNPASDTNLTALADPAAAGAAITCLDMSLAHEGTTFWMAYGRTGPTTRVHGFDSAGTETHDFAGPVTLCTSITVFTEAISSATVRIHLACTESGTTDLDLSTYLGATSALETNTPAFTTGCSGQAGLCVNVSSTVALLLSVQRGSLISSFSYINNTHGIANTADYATSNLCSKSINTRSHPLFATRQIEAFDGSSTHLLVSQHMITNVLFSPVAVADRLLAVAPDVAQMPNLAFDSSTQRSYWARLVKGASGLAQPYVMEHFVARQARRQTAALGDSLYITGGITTVFDGRTVSEAGFLDRPVISLTSQQFAGTSFLTPLATYQYVAVFESYDGNGNRIQSAPSDVLEVTLTGANNQITLSITGYHSLRTGISITSITGFGATDSRVSIVLYRTLNAANGNLTLYREKSGVASPEASIAVFSELSDANLEDEEVVYSQGERESLSGPLPFIAPEASGAIWPSADRILTAQLPDSDLLQESRNLLPFEQANWSDSIAFFRATRGRILGAARLDERRIVWTETEIFELDGEGVDDNGNGTIGAPRRLPSEVGLYAPPGAPELAWQSMVECQLGILFRGTADLIYLLPRGSTAPVPIGLDVQDVLAAFPNLTAAVYVPQDQSVRFVCNNSGNTDSVQLILDQEHESWITEGPYGAATIAAVAYQGRMTTLRSAVVQQQRSSLTPAALIANAWRSGLIHSAGLGQWLRVGNVQFYGEYLGDCALRCVFKFDDLVTETLTAEVNAFTLSQVEQASNAFLASTSSYTLTAGQPYSFKFHPSQQRCESVKVDFEVDIPFPSVVALAASTVANNVAFVFTLPANRVNGDRLIFALLVSLDTSTVPSSASAGWGAAPIYTGTVAGQRLSVYERIIDGTEVDPVFTWTGQASAFGLRWLIRNAHPSAASEVVAVSNASAVTTIAHGNITPSWGLQNTLWLGLLSLSERVTSGNSNVNSHPDGLRRGQNQSTASATPILSGQLIGGDRALRATSLSLGSWTWGDASAVQAITIAVRPNPSIVSRGLDYHYWTLDAEGAGKSALKSPLQMG